MSAVTLMQGDCCEKLNGIPAHSVQETESGKDNQPDCQAGNLPEYGRFPAREVLPRKRCSHDAQMQRHRVSAGKDVSVDGKEALGFLPAGQKNRYRVSGGCSTFIPTAAMTRISRHESSGIPTSITNAPAMACRFFTT